jgi:hypothetical protein
LRERAWPGSPECLNEEGRDMGIVFSDLAHLPQFERIRGDYWRIGRCKSLRHGTAEQNLARKAL